ncbi:MAG: transglutaminase domain-containing protein [Actinobacteria bacterium]|nr:transglutaminase domain-containing protein [Actinomycetota bacterium]
MRKTALLALLPAALIANGWRTLEAQPAGGELLLAAALAIAVALVPGGRLRWLSGIAALLVVTAMAFDLSLLDARPFHGADFFGPALSRFGNGVVDYYEVSLPFEPERQRMHGVLVLAVFAFTVLASLAVAARRPILAAAATFAGAAWPVTLVPEAATTTRGALMLATALLLLAALRPGARRAGGQAAVVGGCVLLAALVAVGSPSVAKGGFLAWEQWEPYTRDAKPVSVQYVWNSDYDGIDFPKTPTTVLKIKAPRRSPYWRATTLDVFVDDLWLEDSGAIETLADGDRDILDGDPLVPRRGFEPRNWLRQDVTVEALQDTHLVGASVPVAFQRGFAGAYGSGIAYVGRLERGQKYSVWSFAAQPTPSQLARSQPTYPDELVQSSPFLSVERFVDAPPFGATAREGLVEQLFAENPDLAAYEPLYRQARRVVGSPRNPYAAAVALEAWFRTGGDFRYDEHPPVRAAAPPLVAFVTGHRRGYCQQFAGSMALMLRYLGIPARVAAGFTTGRFDETTGEWTVADTDAHTWVEVWFEGYGWLPFDPTPGRGRLRGSYTASSLFFDASGATAAFAGAAAAALGLDVLRSRLGTGSPDDRPRGAERGPGGAVAGGGGDGSSENGRGGLPILGALLLIVLGLLSLLWLAKTGRRRARYVTQDPRQVASAVRSELTEYLADQGVALPASATPSDLSRRLRDRLRVDGDALAGALGAARFGPASEADAAARDAHRELRRVLRAVRKRLRARDRLRGLVSLRSYGLG